MPGLLELSAGLPRRSYPAGAVLVREGQPAAALYVLIGGTLRVEKGGVGITTIDQPGACVGEMSLLLAVPATAEVVAETPCEVAVIEDASAVLDREDGLALELARILAARVQAMTSYLVDLKHQYADHEGGLGMVDVVLGTLMQSAGRERKLASARDPDPEY
jgi:CRP-like cAMP-binding protein